ncbi:MAG: PhnD/SsuA/transferrin family substrate-binding protein [Syntrophales bacterium]
MKLIVQSIIICIILSTGPAFSKTIKIAVIQDKHTEGSTYLLLQDYLKSKNIDAMLYSYGSYLLAAKNFEKGVVDIMFTGSGIAGWMIIKNIAYPVVRPVAKEGWSTYSAVIIAPAGSSHFTGELSALKGKRIAACELASSGEFFVRSLLGDESDLVITESHSDALEKLKSGVVDIAVIKNRVWDVLKKKYPGFEQISGDKAEHPNGTLMASYNADKNIIKKLKTLLLGFENDRSPQAMRIKTAMNIKGFILTQEKDFEQTLALLKKAGISERSEFVFHEDLQSSSKKKNNE